MNSTELKLFPLFNDSKNVQIPKRDILDADHWMGALYYNIKEVSTKKKKQYLLFGFDAFSQHQRRKLVDVLSFKKGKPEFGAPIFVTREIDGQVMETSTRFIITYSATGSARLNYDETLDMIVYDNLIPFPSPYSDAGITMVTDGSYKGFKFKKGKWFPVEKLFHQTQEVAPRPNPILDNRKGKGLFGE